MHGVRSLLLTKRMPWNEMIFDVECEVIVMWCDVMWCDVTPVGKMKVDVDAHNEVVVLILMVVVHHRRHHHQHHHYWWSLCIVVVFNIVAVAIDRQRRRRCSRSRRCRSTVSNRSSKLLARRLLARGWSWAFIRPIFREAHNRITNNHTVNPKLITKPKMQPLIIHSSYHPRGLHRQDIRKIFNETLGHIIDNPIIIAQSHPKNLRNRLCRSKLPLLPGCNPSDFLPSGAGTP